MYGFGRLELKRNNEGGTWPSEVAARSSGASCSFWSICINRHQSCCPNGTFLSGESSTTHHPSTTWWSSSTSVARWTRRTWHNSIHIVWLLLLCATAAAAATTTTTAATATMTTNHGRSKNSGPYNYKLCTVLWLSCCKLTYCQESSVKTNTAWEVNVVYFTLI